MADDLPTPDELGEKLKAGEITREEAIEIMSERARREALAGLYSPAPQSPTDAGKANGSGRAATWVGVAIIVFIVVLFVVVQFL